MDCTKMINASNAMNAFEWYIYTVKYTTSDVDFLVYTGAICLLWIQRIITRENLYAFTTLVPWKVFRRFPNFFLTILDIVYNASCKFMINYWIFRSFRTCYENVLWLSESYCNVFEVYFKTSEHQRGRYEGVLIVAHLLCHSVTKLRDTGFKCHQKF